MISKKEYIEQQKEWIRAHSLEAGSKVRVKAIATSHEKGWGNSWEKYMDKALGLEGTIAIIKESAGIGIVFEESEDASYLDYPYFVLEVVKP